ncbi:dienelactone hydrolase family protein [Amycolatopsis sp. QT-25]|uniref:dienelactone hydrolase family protein n=1 Tax=Amycolatopsis sp. QT-25 TaxID=3034022 RepID=UPI0023EB53C5|nr:dienelactone hydrolase family protein [Amycolatopsis sp. QT-25]WET81235.1 dienelactone hydrolase family protein [Amycolatopsis sp. QT-25]
MTEVTVADGSFDAPLWLPESGSGPGLVLIQEIFGLDDYLESVAADLAALGYVVAVPELFWRIAPGWSATHDEAGVSASMAVSGELDPARAVTDVLATLATLRALPETDGRAGVFGFCLGGSMAYAAAAEGDPDVAVSYYGSRVPEQLPLLDEITCPIQFQFGGADPYIPVEGMRRLAGAVASHDGAEIHIHEGAGHAFHNHVAPMFHQPGPAAAAWALTLEFLGRAFPA